MELNTCQIHLYTYICTAHVCVKKHMYVDRSVIIFVVVRELNA